MKHFFTILVFVCLSLCAFTQGIAVMKTVKTGADASDKKHHQISQQVIDTLSTSLKPLLNWYNKHLLVTEENVYKEGDLVTITHTGYTSAMDTRYNLPAWTAHYINRYQLQHPGKFQREDNYPKDSLYPLLKSDLYGSSGYDHGHLAPARDFKHDKLQYAESNNMTNMSPQYGCFNQKGWCMLESLCREWAQEDSTTVTYIVSGPVLNQHAVPNLFIDTLCIKNGLEVYVPAYFFKVVCIYNKKAGIANSIGFIVPNTDVNNEEVIQMQLTIDQVEFITGLNFFSALPDKIESETESILPVLNFNYKSECGSKPCSSVYNKRVRPETRIKLRCN